MGLVRRAAALALAVAVLAVSPRAQEGPIPAPAAADSAAARSVADSTTVAVAARARRDTAALELPTRTVQANRQTGHASDLPMREVRELPGAMNDPIRALATTPGVQVQSDVNARPFVRGGDADMTRVILNGIPLLQPYHTGGAFSIFNLNTLRSAGLYREAFPAEDPGALSGILRLRGEPRLPDRPGARGDLSLVRGDAFAETPVLPGKLSVYGAAQTLLFADAVHGALGLAGAASGDSAFRSEMRGYSDHVNLPALTDWHWGAAFVPGESFRADYMGLTAGDGYAVVVPRESNILSNLNPNFGNPSAPVAPQPNSAYVPPPRHANKLSVDSISAVDIRHQSHFLSLDWDASPAARVEQDAGWQMQDWQVGFRKGPGSPDPPWALSQSIRQFDWRALATLSGEGHRTTYGAAYEYQWHRYRMNLPWVLYEIMVDGNMDMLEPLGYFSGDGFTLRKEDSARSNLDYLGEFPSRIHFTHAGYLEQHTAALFASDAWTHGRGILTYGLRAEYHSLSREAFPAPRADYLFHAGPKTELRAHAGLYSQDNLPFYQRDVDPGLKSEKSAQVGMGATHRFAPGWKLSLDGYYKRYEDLVVPRLEPDHTFDLDGFMLPLPGSELTAEQVAKVLAALDTARDFSALPADVQEMAYENFGGLRYAYANTGSGTSLGAELSLDYTPTPGWHGWASLEAGLSDRRDASGQAWYAYRYHRPVIFNWANRFAFAGGYELALAYRWAMGQPYTTFSGDGDGRGSFDPIVVGARNGGRFAPYSRLDLRLSRTHRAWGREIKTYLEVWNATNSPNYFARDADTGQLRAAQLNWPFPFLFLGLSGGI
jgi:hypothetical protein